MSATISIDKKTIKEFFEASRQKPILIPEYQRPYEWGADEIATLFDDLREFAESGDENTDEYFLGAVVHYNNDNNQREIVDGHQRIVTLTLLLRVIYDQLKTLDENRAVLKYEGLIERLLWHSASISEEPDYSKVLIQSEMIAEQLEKTFLRILETGEVDPKSDDLYSQNYLLLQKLCKQYCAAGSRTAFNFIDSLLDRVIFLPIQADSQDMALTIFSTLNTCGKPLTDADILKSKIYKLLDVDERKIFISRWQECEKKIDELGKDLVKDVFHPFMLYNRALDGWSKPFYSGVRKYFLTESPKHLGDPELMLTIDYVIKFWSVINRREEFHDEPWSLDDKIRQTFDILVSYPNDFWKNAVIPYCLANRSRADFNESFLLFLRKLLSVLVPRCFIRRGIDAFKAGIITLNVESVRSPYPTFRFKPIAEDQIFADPIVLKDKNPNAIKMLLKMIAYDFNREALLPDKWQIEHIFPQKWDAAYDLNGFFPEKINELVKTLGNLTPFESKKNIKASNDFFSKKRQLYRTSAIAMTRALADRSQWTPVDIINRTSELTRRLKTILSTWSDEYDEAKADYDRRHRAETPT